MQRVWINHDHDLVDVRVRSQTASQAAARGATQAAISAASRVAGALKAAAAVASLALTLATGHAVAVPTPTLTSPSAATAQAETIHTTANHLWLTADRGWVPAGDLRAGEPVVTHNGATDTVDWVHPVAGQADMYNLTVANDDTYAVAGVPTPTPTPTVGFAKRVGVSSGEKMGDQPPSCGDATW